MGSLSLGILGGQLWSFAGALSHANDDSRFLKASFIH
jgi:hypothetical protein